MSSFRSTRSKTWAQRILKTGKFDSEPNAPHNNFLVSEYDVFSSDDEVFKPSPPGSPGWTRPAMKSTQILPTRMTSCGSLFRWFTCCCSNLNRFITDKPERSGEKSRDKKCHECRWIGLWLAVAIALPVIWSAVESFNGTSQLSPSFYKCRSSGELSWIPSFAYQVSFSIGFSFSFWHFPFSTGYRVCDFVYISLLSLVEYWCTPLSWMFSSVRFNRNVWSEYSIRGELIVAAGIDFCFALLAALNAKYSWARFLVHGEIHWTLLLRYDWNSDPDREWFKYMLETRMTLFFVVSVVESSFAIQSSFSSKFDPSRKTLLLL